jgi:hypothetical protein
MPSPLPSLLTASAAATLLLGGCVEFASLPPGIPDGPQLESYAKTSFAPPYRIGPTPRDTLVIGIAYVDQRCSEFFDAVEQMARRAELARTGLASATAQSAIIMTAAETSTLAVAYVAGALEVTRALLNEYRVQFTFAPHSSELRSLVIQAMTAQRREFGDLLARNVPLSEVEAIATVKKYAENCTLGAIREHWNNAVAKAVREGVRADVPATSTGVPRALALERSAPRPANVLSVNRYVVK